MYIEVYISPTEGVTNNEMQTIPALHFGGASNRMRGESQALTTVTGGRSIFNSETEYVKSGFTQGNETTSTPITNSNILWGAAAMLGATLADWQRKREEEEASLSWRTVQGKRAEAAAQEEGGRGGKKTPGQKAYEKMMKQKRIVGELQAEMDEKRSDYTPSQKLEDEETNWLKKLSPVYQYEKRKAELQQKAELQAGLSAYYEGRKAGEEQIASTPQSGLLSNLWNAGVSALGSVFSSEKNIGGGGLLSVRDDDPPNPLKAWWDKHIVQPVKNAGEAIWTAISSFFTKESAFVPTPTLVPAQIGQQLAQTMIAQTQTAMPTPTPTLTITSLPTITLTPTPSNTIPIGTVKLTWWGNNLRTMFDGTQSPSFTIVNLTTLALSGEFDPLAESYNSALYNDPQFRQDVAHAATHFLYINQGELSENALLNFLGTMQSARTRYYGWESTGTLNMQPARGLDMAEYVVKAMLNPPDEE